MTNQTDQEKMICVDVPATFKYLHIVGVCLDGILTQESDLEKQATLSHNVQVAVQEICTNIVRHAYKQNHEDERIHITITIQTQPRRLIVELFDTGTDFDQHLVREPDLDQGQVHGYGLFIVKNLMDEVTYCRQKVGNYWYLVKNL